MPPLFTPKQAAEATGASISALRGYAARYSRYLSTEATPPKGQPRQFTEDDLKVFAFVKYQTAQGHTLEQAEQSLADGELDSFEWEAPAPSGAPQPTIQGADPADPTSTALVPVAQYAAAMAVLEEHRRQAAADADTIDALRQQVADLRQELGQAQGELEAEKRQRYRAPEWWRKLFGGRGEE